MTRLFAFWRSFFILIKGDFLNRFHLLAYPGESPICFLSGINSSMWPSGRNGPWCCSCVVPKNDAMMASWLVGHQISAVCSWCIVLDTFQTGYGCTLQLYRFISSSNLHQQWRGQEWALKFPGRHVGWPAASWHQASGAAWGSWMIQAPNSFPALSSIWILLAAFWGMYHLSAPVLGCCKSQGWECLPAFLKMVELQALSVTSWGLRRACNMASSALVAVGMYHIPAPFLHGQKPRVSAGWHAYEMAVEPG